MEQYCSNYPYSMDSLIDAKDRSLSDFFNEEIIPLAFFGLGSVDSLLNLKRHEIKQLERSLQDEDLIQMYHNLHSLGL